MLQCTSEPTGLPPLYYGQWPAKHIPYTYFINYCDMLDEEKIMNQTTNK